MTPDTGTPGGVALPSADPILKSALGADWYRLPMVLRRAFDLRPGSDREVRLKGTMQEIHHSRLAKLFIWPGQLLGALVPYQGKDVPIRIDMRTHAIDRRFMYWHRAHAFLENPEFLFSTRMEYLEGNETIERVRLNIGLRMRVTFDGEELRFESSCYQWDVFGLCIRIPTWLLLGHGVIVERAISDEEFSMSFVIDHPLLGRTFTYRGTFTYV